MRQSRAAIVSGIAALALAAGCATDNLMVRPHKIIGMPEDTVDLMDHVRRRTGLPTNADVLRVGLDYYDREIHAGLPRFSQRTDGERAAAQRRVPLLLPLRPPPGEWIPTADEGSRDHDQRTLYRTQFYFSQDEVDRIDRLRRDAGDVYLQEPMIDAVWNLNVKWRLHHNLPKECLSASGKFAPVPCPPRHAGRAP